MKDKERTPLPSFPEHENLDIPLSQETSEFILTPETSRQIAEVWEQVVLGSKSHPQERNEQELREWLETSLLHEVEKIVDDWELCPDRSYVENIERSQSDGEKTNAQLAYIHELKRKIQEFTDTQYTEEIAGHQYWSTWPSTMRERKAMNCVAATMAAAVALKKAKIDQAVAVPAHHLANVVFLPNQEVLYIDFLNNVEGPIQPAGENILPEEKAKVKFYSVQHPKVTDRTIYVAGTDAIVAASLGNIDALYRAEDDYAHEIKKRNPGLLSRMNYWEVAKVLYPHLAQAEAVPEIQSEQQRNEIFSQYIFRGTEEILSGISGSVFEEGIAIAKKHNTEVEGFILEGNNDILLNEEIPDFVRKLLVKYKDGLREIHERHPEYYKDALEEVLKGLRD